MLVLLVLLEIQVQSIELIPLFTANEAPVHAVVLSEFILSSHVTESVNHDTGNHCDDDDVYNEHVGKVSEDHRCWGKLSEGGVVNYALVQVALQALVQLPFTWQSVSEVVVAGLWKVGNGSEEIEQHEGHYNRSNHFVDVQKHTQKYILHNRVLTHYDHKSEYIKLDMHYQT